MFTGIIEEIGKVKNVSFNGTANVLTIKANKVLEDAHVGDSIAVNGMCLTVTKLYNDSFDVDVMPETMKRTYINAFKAGEEVNLERAMAANGRFGGHTVTGHIDGVGTVMNIQNDDNAVWYTIATEEKILYYIVEKGSVALDGISLTVAYVDDTCFKVSIIPHTKSATILKNKKVGDKINIENDIFGKYVHKFMSKQQEQSKSKSNITEDFLREHGF
jgi:riboflavin synthase